MRYQTLLPFLSALAAAAPQAPAVRPVGLNKVPAGIYIEKPIAGTSPPEAKVTVLKYGPFKVPAGGMIENSKLPIQVASPCSNCYITAMEADMKYADGSEANIDTGAWLHHMVLFNVGPNRVDATCKNNIRPLPELAVGTKAIGAERVMASGNERIPIYADHYTGAKPAAYHINSADSFRMLVDFMNEAMEDRLVYLTMTYDYLPGKPEGYDDVKPIWFDIDQCGFSEMKPKAQTGKFYIDADPWTSDLDGEILSWFGHLHDGGTAVTMFVDGTPQCVSKASYGGPGFTQTEPMMGQPNSATEHISNMTICGNDVTSRMSQMKKGQVWKLRADYDYDAHKGMREDDGSQMEIMGIGFMYMRVPKA